MTLSERVARLEAAAKDGTATQRDLEVIESFLTRAEGKLRRHVQRTGALSPDLRRAVTLDNA